MTIASIANILITAAIIIWFAARQLSWVPLALGRIWRLPVILAAVGVVMVAQTTTGSLSTLDISVLAVEIVLSLGLGAAMGAVTGFRRMSAEAITLSAVSAARAGKPGTAATYETRTGWLGLAFLVALVAIRFGIGFWAEQAGSTLAESTGIILVMFAANRFARAAVVVARMQRPTPVTA